MEKRVVLAMLLSIGLLMGYTWLQSEFAPPPAPPPAPPAQGAGTPGPTTGTAGTSTGVGTPNANGGNANGGGANDGGANDGSGGGGVAPGAGAEAVVEAPPTEEELDTERLFLNVTSEGAAISRADVWACVYHAPGDPEAKGDPGVATDHFAGKPGLGAIDLVGVDASLGTRHWAMERTENGVTCTMDVPSMGVRFVKTFTPSRDEAAPYHVILTVEALGLPSERITRQATLEVVGPWFHNPPLPQPEDGILVARVDEDPEYHMTREVLEWMEETPGYSQPAPTGVRWIGTRSDFHLGVLEGVEPLPAGTSIGFHHATRPGEEPGESVQSAAASLLIPFVLPEPGETTSMRFRLYVGPNSRPMLTAEDSPYATLKDAPANRRFLGIGFGPIESVLGWLLKLIASTGMGYGLAVACLTILVRGALFPLSRKSQISMRVHAKKMAGIKPKMDAIKKKYKDSKKQQEMTMKLMREEKVSPVPGGCLLAFVQMPVWISLYGILQTTYEMRHATFLWAHDLTGPDHLLAMPWFEGVPLLPEWLNLFPILMMITWGISARLQPLPVDPQQRSQAKMMRWMPMLFGLFLYKFAAGLCLYMTCSALWSILEVNVIRKVWLSKIDEQFPTPAPAAENG